MESDFAHALQFALGARLFPEVEQIVVVELLYQAAKRDAAAIELLDVMFEQVVPGRPFVYQPVDQRLDIRQIVDVGVDAAGDLAAQQNVAVALDDALEIIVVEVEQ